MQHPIGRPELLGFAAYLRCSLILLSSLVTLLFSGCGHSSSTDTKDSNLRVLVALYSLFVKDSGGQPPQNKEQFINFIHAKGQRILDLGKIKDVNSIFISQRDHQPFLLLYGKQAQGQKTAGLVACEQVGVAGKRLVGYSLGGVEELDESRFKNLGFRENPSK